MKELLSNKLIKNKNNVINGLSWNEKEFGYNLLHRIIANAIKKRNAGETNNFSMWFRDECFALKILFVFKNGEEKKHSIFWQKNLKIIKVSNIINAENKFINEKKLKKIFINSIKNIVHERNII